MTDGSWQIYRQRRWNWPPRASLVSSSLQAESITGLEKQGHDVKTDATACFQKGAITVLQPQLSEMYKKKKTNITARWKRKKIAHWSCWHYISTCKWASSDQGSPFSESRNSAVHLSAWLCLSAGSLRAVKKQEKQNMVFHSCKRSFCSALLIKRRKEGNINVLSSACLLLQLLATAWDGNGMRWDGIAPTHDNLHRLFKGILTCCLERRPVSHTRGTRWFPPSSPGCRWSRLTWNDPPVLWELALPVFFCCENRLRRRQWGDRCSLGGNRGWQERRLGSGQDGRVWLRVKE